MTDHTDPSTPGTTSVPILSGAHHLAEADRLLTQSDRALDVHLQALLLSSARTHALVAATIAQLAVAAHGKQAGAVLRDFRDPTFAATLRAHDHDGIHYR